MSIKHEIYRKPGEPIDLGQKTCQERLNILCMIFQYVIFNEGRKRESKIKVKNPGHRG